MDGSGEVEVATRWVENFDQNVWPRPVKILGLRRQAEGGAWRTGARGSTSATSGEFGPSRPASFVFRSHRPVDHIKLRFSISRPCLFSGPNLTKGTVVSYAAGHNFTLLCVPELEHLEISHVLMATSHQVIGLPVSGPYCRLTSNTRLERFWWPSGLYLLLFKVKK